jgi:hypothetical protein
MSALTWLTPVIVVLGVSLLMRLVWNEARSTVRTQAGEQTVLRWGPRMQGVGVLLSAGSLFIGWLAAFEAQGGTVFLKVVFAAIMIVAAAGCLLYVFRTRVVFDGQSLTVYGTVGIEKRIWFDDIVRMRVAAASGMLVLEGRRGERLKIELYLPGIGLLFDMLDATVPESVRGHTITHLRERILS